MQPSHALEKLMSSLASVLNVTAGKEVKPTLLQSRHVPEKVVPLERSRAGKEANPLQLCHVWKKSVPLDVSNNGKEVSPPQPAKAVEKLVTLDVSMTGKEVIEGLVVHT